MKPRKRKTLKWLCLATLLASTPSWLAGCHSAPKLQVIPANKEVLTLPVGQPFTNTVPGYFVPDATMIDLLNAWDEAKILRRQ